MAEINLLDRYPRSKRPIDERSAAVTDADRAVARQFGREYFDGDRLTGYGGYRYDGRWKPVVERFRDHYGLKPDARILDVGCAKGFMLHDFQELMPAATLAGIDVSEYALEHAMPSVRPFMQLGSADTLPFGDNSFDLVISITTIHNLDEPRVRKALREVERVSRGHSFVTLDAWRTPEEFERLNKWNLTAQTYMHVPEWETLFREAGYTGDYYWFIAE